jgi:hypothetical protein
MPDEPITTPTPEPTPEPEPVTPTPTPMSTADIEGAVGAVVTQLRKGAQDMEAARSRPVPATPAAPTKEPLRPADLDKLASEQGAGAAFSAFTNEVLMPMQAANVKTAVQFNRSLVQRDAELGPLMARYKDQIATKIKDEGITDIYLAQHGFEGLIRSIAGQDPAYINELADKKMAEKVAAANAAAANQPKPPTPTPPRVASETVNRSPAAPPAAPNPATDEAAAIAAIEVDPQQEQILGALCGMDKGDIQKQKHEIAKWEQRLGPLGVAQAGGIPICEFDEIGLKGGD